MIELNQLSFSYKRQNPLFSSLNLKIPEGNIYGLLGKNGAGKTTLLKLISGLLFPKSGLTEVMGFKPQNRLPAFLSDLVFIPEDLFVPRLKIDQYVNLYAPFYPKFNHEQFGAYLNQFEIPRDKKLSNLSYGQKKKTLLCFGLATNARLLILDEPTNGLDIPSKSQLRSLLAGSMTDDRTIIISTHQVRDMANLIDPIIILEAGEIIFQQSLEAITRHLYFELTPSMEPPEGALYAERVPGGFLAVYPNPQGLDSEVDIEVLFNTVVHQREKVNNLF